MPILGTLLQNSPYTDPLTGWLFEDPLVVTIFRAGRGGAIWAGAARPDGGRESSTVGGSAREFLRRGPRTAHAPDEIEAGPRLFPPPSTGNHGG